jgi:uncharacterized tellurite resistance protein B-like protein
MSIFDFFKRNFSVTEKSVCETDAIRKIIQSFELLDPQQARFIAAFAYLLSRVARADLNISSEETKAMEKIIMEHSALNAEQAMLAIQAAKSQSILFGSTENFIVAREFSNMADHDEKMRLLDCIYAVAAADGSISTLEDNEASQIANELRIEHHDLIAVRSRYRNKLAVLRDSIDRQSS